MPQKAQKKHVAIGSKRPLKAALRASATKWELAVVFVLLLVVFAPAIVRWLGAIAPLLPAPLPAFVYPARVGSTSYIATPFIGDASYGTLNSTNYIVDLVISWIYGSSKSANYTVDVGVASVLFVPYAPELAWSEESVTPTSPVVYNPAQGYTFSIKWTGDPERVTLQFWRDENVFPPLYDQNTAIPVVKQGLYYVLNLPSLPAGTYRYRWTAYKGGGSSFAEFAYAIAKAPTPVALSIDGQTSDRVVSLGAVVQIIANITDARASGFPLSLRTNFTGSMLQTAPGTGNVSYLLNTTNSTQLPLDGGAYLINASAPGNDNWTANSTALRLIVAYVNFTNAQVSPPSGAAYAERTYQFTVTCDGFISNVLLELGNSNITANRLGNTCLVSTTNLNVAAGCPSGTLSYWNFDEGNGTIARDSIGPHNGTFFGSPTWTATSIAENALAFNTPDYIDAGRIPLNGSVSVSMWFKANTVPFQQWIGLATSAVGGSHEGGWTLSFTNDGTLGFSGANLGFSVNNYAENRATKIWGNDTNWHHVVGTYDGSTVRIYVDGGEGTSDAYSGAVNDTNNVLLGRSPETFGYFNGLIDEVTIHSRALSPAEVSAQYYKGLARSKACAPVHAYRWWATDTAGKWYASDVSSYEIVKANVTLGMLLNSMPKSLIANVSDNVQMYVSLDVAPPSTRTLTIKDPDPDSVIRETVPWPENLPYSYVVDKVDRWNVSASFDGDTNHNPSSITRWIAVGMTDNLSPQWSNANQSSDQPSYGGRVDVWTSLSDDVLLDSSWLETNASGTWRNGTALYIGDPARAVNFTIDLQQAGTPPNQTAGWRIWANDTSGRLNSTDMFNFTVQGDAVVPTVSNQSQTELTTRAGEPADGVVPVNGSIRFSALCTDDTLLKEARIETNETGVPSNITALPLNAKSSVVNYTWNNPNVGTGPNGTTTSLYWKIYCVDYSNNANSTDSLNFTVKVFYPADFNRNSTIEDAELLNRVIPAWRVGTIELIDIIKYIGLWRAKTY